MCGIAGFCSKKIDQIQVIQRMNDAMYNRGPDGSGYWLDENSGVTLGHCRLSIMDVSSAGAQPMISNDSRWIISYNGEIYNHSEIKKKLMLNNVKWKFRSTSDTEILLEAFAAWGIQKTLDNIKGMFAIAIYDRQEKKLYLLRDRMGEKPLYYGFVDNIFVFASDLKAIRCMNGFRDEINQDILAQYFKYGYIPAPYSIFNGIYKLEQAQMLTIEEPFNEFKLQTFWDLEHIALEKQEQKFDGTETEAINELTKLLKETIKQMMVADVPIGSFLSSGTDSSLVTAIMQKMSSTQIKTFTIGFENENWNEASNAKKIANYLGTNHTELYFEKKDIEEAFIKMPSVYSEPFADNSQIVTYLISKIAREKVTVALSGDGGDELFAGYSKYRQLDQIWKTYHSEIKRERKDLYTNEYKENLYRNSCSPQQLQRSYYAYAPQLDELVIAAGKSVCFYDNEKQYGFSDPISIWMLADQRQYLPDDILVKVDRAGMNASLENRIPLLDKDIMEFTWSLPTVWKCDESQNKKILKKILYKMLPASFFDEQKKGFNIPISNLLKESKNLFSMAEELLCERRIRQQGILNYECVDYFWSQYIKYDKNWKPVIWYILMFEMWYESIRSV